MTYCDSGRRSMTIPRVLTQASARTKPFALLWYPICMDMVTSATQRDGTVQEGCRALSPDPRCFSPVQPRPMVKIYKG